MILRQLTQSGEPEFDGGREVIVTARPDWEPGTSADDTLLRHGVLALTATWEATGQVSDGRVHRDDRCSAVDLGRPAGFFNGAIVLRPVSEEGFATTVGQLERFYDGNGAGAALLWSPLPTPDLTGRGWVLQGHPPLLYRPARHPVERHEPQGLTVTEVATESDLAEWCAVAVESFPLTEVDVPSLLFDPAVLTDDRFRFIVGRVGHRAVADRLARAPDLPSATTVVRRSSVASASCP